MTGRIFFKQKNRRGVVWRITNKIHRWSSYLLFLPISFWIIGGAYMTWVPIELVRSEQTIVPAEPVAMNSSEIAALQTFGSVSAFRRIDTVRVADKPAFLVYDSDGQQSLYAQSDYRKLSPLGEDMVRQVALSGYNGGEGVTIASINLITENPPSEVRGRPLPIWQVNMNNGTSLYISPDNGRIVARRSDVWRVFDFFWMLHTLDFEGRDDFNNKLVMTMSGLALIFLLSGLILTYLRITKVIRKR